MRRDVCAFLVVLGVVVGVVLAVVIPLVALHARAGSLYTSVRVESIAVHLARLQQIADDNGGNRGTLSPAFNQSVAYVTQVLVGMGYAPVLQPFAFGFFEVRSSPRLTIGGIEVPSSAVANVPYGGSGHVSGLLGAAGAGCSGGAYAGLSAGSVALVWDGPECTTDARVAAATAVGMAALVVVRVPGLPAPRLSGPHLAPLPVLLLSDIFGAAVASGALPAPARVFADNAAPLTYSSNLIAESKEGDRNAVVVVGAHLDSVGEGPGINDNGSGSATVLQIAVEMARLQLNPTNKVRFVWFGGEEKGLLGSKHYVASLSPDDRFRMALMLNFDMLASPNHFIGVYDGRSGKMKGSAVIQDVFEGFARSFNIPTEGTPFDGRSDYGPFLDFCPAGGLFTGAEALKSADQAALYGGMEGVQFDPCYHQVCDSLDNVNWSVLSQTSHMAAYAVQHFAFLPALRVALGDD